MIEINEKENCNGCHGCFNICPKKCISMEIDNEGFWYPKVDKSKCIDCNLCEKVCPIINDPKKDNTEIVAYACKNKNEEDRIASSSGGIFSLLCEEVIRKGGIVFGASFNENFEVRHTYAETLEECIQFRGSKYVQSKIGNTYKEAESFLKSGKIVLFSGTQCQIKGLNLYLRKEYDNLILVDIVCHGVPSPRVFKAYKNKIIDKYGDEIRDIRFRDKTKGWKEFSYVTEFKGGKVYSETLGKDLYMKGFLKDLYLRPSCYSCTAKNYTSGSDLSLADFWGVELKHPEFDDDKGVSLILSNTKKGKDILNMISKKIEILEADLEHAIKYNPCIVKSVEYNDKRESFFNDFNEENVEEVIEKYTKVLLRHRIKNKIFGIVKKVKKCDS